MGFLKNKWVLIGIGVLLVIAIIGGASSGGDDGTSDDQATKTESSTATEVKPTPTSIPTVGSTVAKGNWEITLDSAERLSSLPALFGESEEPQGVFLVILAKFKNIGKEAYLMNSWDANVLTPDETKYELISEFGLLEREGYEDLNFNVKVQPGLSEDVRLIFDVPPGITGLTLDIQGVRFALPD